MQSNELFTQRHTILLDGGMGTMLQAAGLKLGARPEELNITDPETIQRIHGMYAAAGSRIINTNTFGASGPKLAKSPYTVEEVIAAGVACCKKACAPYGALTALDIGPLGELLEPNGTLPFETAVAEFARIVRAGAAAGADLVMVETFTDLYELKAALLAVKENCKLPVLASMSFEARGRTFTGCTVESFGVTVRGLGASAVGINCSLGPKEIFPMAKRLTEALPGSFPVFVKPNAGLPRADGSGYDITPLLYAMQMKPYRELGLFAAGGCCGTTPEFIQLLNGVFADCRPGRPDHPMKSVVCSPMDCVDVDGITVVGERINPTGKKRFQQALREGDMNYVLEQAVMLGDTGIRLNLFDTAGVRDVGEHGDAVEAEGIRRSWKKLDEAGLILAVFDGSEPLTREDLALAQRCAGRPAIALVNKEDKPTQFDAEIIAGDFAMVLPVCCQEEGIRRVIAAAVALLLGTNNIDPHAASLSGQRQLAAATRARDAVAGALDAVSSGFGLDAVSVCVDDALDALCDLTGENASENVINEVFERFCVGK